MNDKSIYFKLMIAYITFSLIAIIIPGVKNISFAEVIIALVAFLFGIILAFSITNRQHRLSSIRQLLRLDDGLIIGLLSTYKNIF
jgi:hypothetical protein